MSDNEKNDFELVEVFAFNPIAAIRFANTLIEALGKTNHSVDTIVAGLLLTSVLHYSRTDSEEAESGYYFQRIAKFLEVLQEANEDGVLGIHDNTHCDCEACTTKRKSDPNPNLH